MLRKKMAMAEEDLVMMLEMFEEAENDVQKLTKWIRAKEVKEKLERFRDEKDVILFLAWCNLRDKLMRFRLLSGNFLQTRLPLLNPNRH